MHTDPGHGWLEVPFKELAELGIENKISSYSYVDMVPGGFTIYLEEDCDYTRFAEAWEARFGYDFASFVTEQYHDPCFIRDLPNYMPVRR